MITIANPIYDIVFKYLMEDERIARTILSALLKKDIIKVEVRPHEYANGQRDTLSVYRIDFGATVRESDGKEQLILIELQKTWLETETLRFRQYLGVQYQNPANINSDGYALPTIAVYLLGHKVGGIEEPVLYVRHHSYDYNEQVVTRGIPDPFINSLTHDSIIVQIPRLHGQINNKLDRVLSIFDQSRKDQGNQQILNIDDAAYSGDADMQHILHRLLMAATNATMRQDMNVEDEYFSIIEKRDTEILQRDHELAKQKVQLEEQGAQLVKQSAQLEEQSAQLEKKDSLLRSSIQMLLKSGLSIDAIAAQMGISPAEIERLTITI